MANNRTTAATGLHRVDRLAREEASTGRSGPDANPTPHLATGFFVIAATMVVAVFIAGSMDSQVRLAGVSVAAVVASMIMFWMIVAQPTIESLAAARSQHDLDRTKNESVQHALQTVASEKERSTAKVARLDEILAATQRGLDHEISVLESAVGHLAAEVGGAGSAAIDQVEAAIQHVQKGQRGVAAIVRLGTAARTSHVSLFRASDLVPLTEHAVVTIERDEEMYGDVDLWRVFVNAAARNSEAHGGATEFTLASYDGRLTITDDGKGCTTADLLQAWKAGRGPDGRRSAGIQIMRRIAEAHDGTVSLHGEPGVGVRIVADLRDLEIDLRDHGVHPARIRTPHKASGGRINNRSSG